MESRLALLRLLHLSDSALPIGGLAHSFGLESLVEEGLLTAPLLESYLRDSLEETGRLEAAFCGAAYRAAAREDWRGLLELDAALAARKPARETREASAMLGRRILELAGAMQQCEVGPPQLHYPMAFGVAGQRFQAAGLDTVAAFLHQSTASLLSACQRLMPLGQQAAMRMLWNLKPAIVNAAAYGWHQDPAHAVSFSPLTELASMRHPRLGTRLFIS